MEASMTATVSLPSIDKFVLRLARRAWEIAIAIKHRRELTRLADRDDRMLTDIGLSRIDLYDARSEPFWADPTTFLQQRVRRRRYK
jgi:uncharacterized protein YjiS (DUF1127 family)